MSGGRPYLETGIKRTDGEDQPRFRLASYNVSPISAMMQDVDFDYISKIAARQILPWKNRKKVFKQEIHLSKVRAASPYPMLPSAGSMHLFGRWRVASAFIPCVLVSKQPQH